MANTYTNLFVHVIFAVKFRQHLIPADHRDELEKFICGIIRNKKSKPIAIYCNPDHAHILIGLAPEISLSSLVRDIKTNSTEYINHKKWIGIKFQWQEGFAAYSYSRSQISKVAEYIAAQNEHHKNTTFQEEYLSMLDKAQIEYDIKYVFDDIQKDNKQ